MFFLCFKSVNLMLRALHLNQSKSKLLPTAYKALHELA